MRRLAPSSLWRIGMLLSLLAPSACDDPAPSPDAPAATASAAATSSAASATSATAAPKHPHQGSYRGSFDAKKSSVPVDEGVSYPTWDEDEGKAAVGEGTVELAVDGAGAVSGKLGGALGDLRLRGSVDEAILGASLEPKDPNAESAMTGTLTGTFDGKGALKGKLRVSSRDGNLARTADVSLKRTAK